MFFAVPREGEPRPDCIVLCSRGDRAERAVRRSKRVESAGEDEFKRTVSLSSQIWKEDKERERRNTERVNQRLKDLELPLRVGSTVGDGNCLLHAIIDQCKQHYPALVTRQDMQDHRTLRTSLMNHIQRDPNLEKFVGAEQMTADFLKPYQKDGVDLDSIHVAGLASLLDKHIVVVDDTLDKQVFSPNCFEAVSEIPLDALVLGRINNNHYVTTVSTVSHEDADVGVLAGETKSCHCVHVIDLVYAMGIRCVVGRSSGSCARFAPSQVPLLCSFCEH